MEWAIRWGSPASCLSLGLNYKRPKLRRIVSDPAGMVGVVKCRDRLTRVWIECVSRVRCWIAAVVNARLAMRAFTATTLGDEDG
jgi:hypothetical protein